MLIMIIIIIMIIILILIRARTRQATRMAPLRPFSPAASSEDLSMYLMNVLSLRMYYY